MNLNDEIMLTSLALGELEGEEKMKAEALVAGDVRAKAYYDEMVGLSEELSRSMSAEAAPGLDPARRAVIEKVTGDADDKPAGIFQMDLRPFAVAAGFILAIAGAISFSSSVNAPQDSQKNSEVATQDARPMYSLEAQKNMDPNNTIAPHGVVVGIQDQLRNPADLYKGSADAAKQKEGGGFIGFTQNRDALNPGPAGEASALAVFAEEGEKVTKDGHESRGRKKAELVDRLDDATRQANAAHQPQSESQKQVLERELKTHTKRVSGDADRGGHYRGIGPQGKAPVIAGRFANKSTAAGGSAGPANPGPGGSAGVVAKSDGPAGGMFAGGAGGAFKPADGKSKSSATAGTSFRIHSSHAKPDASKNPTPPVTTLTATPAQNPKVAAGYVPEFARKGVAFDLPTTGEKTAPNKKAKRVLVEEVERVRRLADSPGTLGVHLEPVPADATVTYRYDNRHLGNSGESYADVKENDFAMVGVAPLSTIGLDVDTASYANVRRHLEAGQWPPRNAVRVDEMVNYFHYDDPLPENGEPLRVSAEVAACPWNLENRLLRIGFKAKTIDRESRGPSNLVFLVDVSGSMKDANKLPLLVRGLKAMVKQLGEDDRVAIVTYSGSSGLALPATRGSDKGLILAALDRLAAGGSTNGASGIELAYNTASENFDAEGVNRVILCTDGDFNVGISDTNSLIKMIKEKAKTGVFLSVLGFGSGNIKDDKMEALANKGNGHYAYIDGDKEAKKVLVEELEGTLITVAKDCKLQIEFNPAEVMSYRLLGYTARQLAAEDFNDDTKDGGEIGAGHSVVALYEIRPANGKNGGPKVDPLKYQKQVEPTEAGAPGEIATVKVRYKLPDEAQSRVRLLTIMDKGSAYGDASTDFKLSSSVALFGMLLSHSPFAGQTTFDTAFELALASLGKENDPRGLRKELCGLIQAAKVIRNQGQTPSKQKGER